MAILTRERNCWVADAPLDACGLLIDGREYYRAFYHAVRQAKRYVLVAGWKFNSNVRLLRGSDTSEARGPIELLPFLKGLVEATPDLLVKILAWDYSVIYAWEWEWDLPEKFSTPDRRLEFRFDSQHAVGASHHQKFVVIDGQVAFVGGFDFNGDDWDDRAHLPENPEREDEGKHHGPYHDVQAALVGPAAAQLAGYFQQRWQASGADPLHLPAPSAPTSVDVGLPIAARRVALSLNQPRTMTQPNAVLQIRRLYEDAILAARAMIYMENQYFTSDVIADALVRRLTDETAEKLDIAVVLPKQLPGWVEAATLEPPRLRLLERLSQIAQQHGHRLGIYYSAAPGPDAQEVATLIHSKLLIVDDRFLTVGSANASDRSQNLDTELNVSWEADDAEVDLRASIQCIRVSLLAEHCGNNDQAFAAQLEPVRGLVDVLDHWADSRHGRLRRITREAILQDRTWLTHLERVGFSLDPAGPYVDELF